jgi:signal transduction histidine kinase
VVATDSALLKSKGKVWHKSSMKEGIVDFSTHIDIVFEPQVDPVMVYADKVRIFEVVSSLIDNAINIQMVNPSLFQP